MTRFKELGPNVYGEAEVPPRATSLPLSHAHPMLSVGDVDAALEYYRTALGFFVEWAQRNEDGSTTIANIWRGALSLFLRVQETARRRKTAKRPAPRRTLILDVDPSCI